MVRLRQPHASHSIPQRAAAGNKPAEGTKQIIAKREPLHVPYLHKTTVGLKSMCNQMDPPNLAYVHLRIVMLTWRLNKYGKPVSSD